MGVSAEIPRYRDTDGAPLKSSFSFLIYFVDGGEYGEYGTQCKRSVLFNVTIHD
jgi:hypothetical protein